MRGRFNIVLQLEDETGGEIIRSAKTDVYIDTPDGCSFDYQRDVIIAACTGVIEIINDV